jgi:hypothetical protein
MSRWSWIFRIFLRRRDNPTFYVEALKLEDDRRIGKCHGILVGGEVISTDHLPLSSIDDTNMVLKDSMANDELEHVQ